MSIFSKRSVLRLALLVFLANITGVCKPQIANPYNYQDLSHLGNVSLRDSLKKNWKAPNLYKDKETQKKFKEMWDSRTAFIVDAIDGNDYIQEKEVYNYVAGIISQLQEGNAKLIAHKPILLIDRSSSVNAYSVGSHIICVNLGLISFASCREEIALVIAHELSHDILEHAEKSMKERAEWLTSEEYKKSLNQVLDSKYERYTRLKKVMETYTFSRTRHNRYHEGEADSLAVVLLKNSNIPFDARFFLRLDSADIQYQLPLKKPVKDYFVSTGLPFDDSWTKKTSKGLSSRNYNFNKKEALADSMKTHPDCKERYEKTSNSTTLSGMPTAIPSSLTTKVNKMIIWNIFDNRSMTACLYRILQEQDKGTADEWYQFMMNSVFAGLIYSDNQLERFNSINVTSKEYISQEYYELQTMLEQIPNESLETYFKNLSGRDFWQKLPADARALKTFYVSLVNKNTTAQSNQSAAKSFTLSNSTSMYCEIADHFITK